MGKKKTEEVEVKAPEPKEDEEEEEDTPVVKALKEIDLKYCKIEAEFEAEVEKLRLKTFNERQAPLLEERAKALADTTGASEEDKLCGTPACKGFWLQAFQNADDFAEVLEEHDEPVFEYLQDIKKSHINPAVPQKGMKLEFIFKENPYFTNSTLCLEFHVEYDPENYKPWMEPQCIELKATEIDWKAGKNVTVAMVQKQVKGGGAKKAKQKAKGAKEEPRESFFRLLFRNLKVGDAAPADLKQMMGGGDDDDDDDDDEDMVKMMLDQLHALGDATAEQIIPYAVRFYTGEAGDGPDDDDDEESEEEDDDDDDDDDEDEDSEDEPPAAKKKGGKKAPAAAGGKKEEECKQQ